MSKLSRHEKILQLWLTMQKFAPRASAQWHIWLKKKKTFGDRQEIVIGSILTQNTSWRNVEKALDNLRQKNLLRLSSISEIEKNELEELKILIKPAGFFNQKAVYLKNIADFFQKNGGVKNFYKRKDLKNLRQELLKIKGVGRETADSILNYALDKPVFVIDSYTKKFLKKEKFKIVDDYEKLRKTFEESLPKDFSVYQKFHALIVERMKNLV